MFTVFGERSDGTISQLVGFDRNEDARDYVLCEEAWIDVENPDRLYDVLLITDGNGRDEYPRRVMDF